MIEYINTRIYISLEFIAITLNDTVFVIFRHRVIVLFIYFDILSVIYYEYFLTQMDYYLTYLKSELFVSVNDHYFQMDFLMILNVEALYPCFYYSYKVK